MAFKMATPFDLLALCEANRPGAFLALQELPEASQKPFRSLSGACPAPQERLRPSRSHSNEPLEPSGNPSGAPGAPQGRLQMASRAPQEPLWPFQDVSKWLLEPPGAP